NNELANTGIGKAYLTAGDNKAAMHYLKLGMNRKYYSIAFKRYRNEILKENLSLIMTVVIVLIVLLIVYKKYLKRIIRAKFRKGGLT
ncbi:MAG: gluconolactonase, partial [Lachnospiraceae bacterium]|nr:gluconolactonase [Lachnospiraceae bacterium]